MRPFAVAAVQMPVKNHHDNVAEITRRIDDLMEQFPWVQMVVLSELAPCGHALESAEPRHGPKSHRFSEVAARHGIWFVPGSYYEVEDGLTYNASPVIDPDGQIVGWHRKMFPFSPYEDGVTAGSQPFVFDIPGVGRFGVVICYDLWFPEVARWLVCEGVEVILHPSLTDTIDRDIELAIVRAAAAQNQCYIINVNGLDDGGTGRSMVVGPAGDVIHLSGTHYEQIPLELDLDRVSRSREVGLRGLGQPLKSFRDREFEFPCYQVGYQSPFLNSLGPLQKPKRGTLLGIKKDDP